eukprot:ctg_1688.g453
MPSAVVDRSLGDAAAGGGSVGAFGVGPPLAGECPRDPQRRAHDRRMRRLGSIPHPLGGCGGGSGGGRCPPARLPDRRIRP